MSSVYSQLSQDRRSQQSNTSNNSAHTIASNKEIVAGLGQMANEFLFQEQERRHNSGNSSTRRSEIADEDLLPLSPGSPSNSVNYDNQNAFEQYSENGSELMNQQFVDQQYVDQQYVDAMYCNQAVSETPLPYVQNAYGSDAEHANLICETVPQQGYMAPPMSSYSETKYSNSSGSMKNIKRDLCQFWMKGCCERGVTCTYAHGEHQIGEEITAPPIVTCKFWLQGQCKLGSRCKWAHIETSDPNELFAADSESAKQQAKAMLKPKNEEIAEDYYSHPQVNPHGGFNAMNGTYKSHKGKQNNHQQQWDNQNWNQGYNQTQQWNQNYYGNGYQNNNYQNNGVQQKGSKYDKLNPKSRNNSGRSSDQKNNTPSTSSKTSTEASNFSAESVLQVVQGQLSEAKESAKGVSAPISINRPQTEEERLKLLALLGDVVAALK